MGVVLSNAYLWGGPYAGWADPLTHPTHTHMWGMTREACYTSHKWEENVKTKKASLMNTIRLMRENKSN